MKNKCYDLRELLMNSVPGVAYLLVSSWLTSVVDTGECMLGER